MYSEGRGGVPSCADCGAAFRLMPWPRSGARFGPWQGDYLGSVGFSALRLAGELRFFELGRWSGGSRASEERGPGVLFGPWVFLGLVVDSSAEGRGWHPQRGGKLGQREVCGPTLAAGLLDVVDGHSR